MISKQTKEIFSSAMSEQNLMVSYENVSTAYILLSELKIVIPNFFSEFSKDTNIFVVLHELSHAKWTPHEVEKLYPDLFKDELLTCIINILEDLRVEKLLKKTFPNSKNYLKSGYGELAHNNFFGKDLSETEHTDFLNRINLDFKLYQNIGASKLQFIGKCPKEQNLYHKASSCMTFDDVYRVSLEIKDFLAEQKEKETSSNNPNSSNPPNDNSTNTDNNDNNNDSDTSLDSTGNLNAKNDNLIQNFCDDDIEYSEMIPQSIKSFEKQSKKRSKECRNSPQKHCFDIEFLKSCIEEVQIDLGDAPRNLISNRYFDINKIRKCSKILVQEFLKKQNAETYYKTRSYETGKINLKKIHLHRTDENIFLKDETVPKGQNHGLIMLLDASNSMEGIRYRNSLRKIMVLCDFCNFLKIPFQIFDFTTKDGYHENDTQRIQIANIINSKEYSINPIDSLKELNYISEHRIKLSCMSATPISPSILLMEKHIDSMVNEHKCEIVNLLVLTDGEPNRELYVLENIRASVFDNSSKVKTSFLTCEKDISSMHIPTAMVINYLKKKFRDKCELNIIGIYVSESKDRLPFGGKNNYEVSSNSKNIMKISKKNLTPYDDFMVCIESDLEIFLDNSLVIQNGGRPASKIKSFFKNRNSDIKDFSVFADKFSKLLQKNWSTLK